MRHYLKVCNTPPVLVCVLALTLVIVLSAAGLTSALAMTGAPAATRGDKSCSDA